MVSNPKRMVGFGIVALCCVAAIAQDRRAGWSGANSRTSAADVRLKEQDFGYLAPAGDRKDGRIGGAVWRSITPAYYGKVVGPFTFDDALSASGAFSLAGATATQGWQNGSTIFIGFFNQAEQGWRPVNFVGFRLEGYNEPDGATVELTYGTSRWTAGGAFVNAAGGAQERLVRDLDSSQLLRVAPDGAEHRWSLDYDPRANGGAGAITLTIDGATSVLPIPPEHRQQGASFDRFGMFNAQMPGNAMTAYLADLTINGAAEDLTRDPKWDGRGNRDVIRDTLHYGFNDFGHNEQTGEVGGRFWRVEKSEPQFKGHYGGRVGRLTMDERLIASGKLRVPRFCVDSGMHFGWYNSREQGWPPRNFVGVYLDSFTEAGRFITPMYGTRNAGLEAGEDGRVAMIGAAHGDARPLFYPDGRVYDWRLEYDPEANGGNGAITFHLGEEKSVLQLKPGDKRAGAEFDRFGLFNMQDNNGKDCVIYLDELSYTVSREH